MLLANRYSALTVSYPCPFWDQGVHLLWRWSGSLCPLAWSHTPPVRPGVDSILLELSCGLSLTVAPPFRPRVVYAVGHWQLAVLGILLESHLVSLQAYAGCT